MKKALLFINGDPPDKLPPLRSYDLVACTDGALEPLVKLGITAEDLDFISGDFDSHFLEKDSEFYSKHIYTPNQEHTDFYKALELLEERGVKSVEVYGGSGGEMDHFLGNLSVALRFKLRMEIRFFDRYSTYYFLENTSVLNEVEGRMISLYPYPKAENVRTRGLNWELFGEDLELSKRIGTRNFALSKEVKISFSKGNLLVFIGEFYPLSQK